MRRGGRDSEARLFPVSHALTVVISQGRGPEEHVLPHQEWRKGSLGNPEGARAPAERLRAQTETRLCSQLHGW